MEESKQEQTNTSTLDEYKQISDILAVPKIGTPLLDNRRWKLPCPDVKALADHPDKLVDPEVIKCLEQTSTSSGERKTGEGYVKDSLKQSGRK